MLYFIDHVVWGIITCLVLHLEKYSFNFLIFKNFFRRGKGDYHRLGHGSDDHVRRPRKVAALQGKKIISIATGIHFNVFMNVTFMMLFMKSIIS